jgi:hypothetical protein
MAVGTGHIQNAAIVNAHIQDATIKSAKIESLTADKIVAGTLNAGLANIVSGASGDRLKFTGSGLSAYNSSDNLNGWQWGTLGGLGYLLGYSNGTQYSTLQTSSTSTVLAAQSNANLCLRANGTGKVIFDQGTVDFSQTTVTGLTTTGLTICWG